MDFAADGLKRSSRVRKPSQRLRLDADAAAHDSSGSGPGGGTSSGGASAGTQMLQRLPSDLTSGGTSAAASQPDGTPTQPPPTSALVPKLQPPAVAGPAAALDTAAQPPPAGRRSPPKRARSDTASGDGEGSIMRPEAGGPTVTRKRTKRGAAAKAHRAAAATAPLADAAPGGNAGGVWLPGVPLPFVQRDYCFHSVLRGDSRTVEQAVAEADACVRALCMQPNGLRSVDCPPLTHFTVARAPAAAVPAAAAAASAAVQ